MFCSMHTHSLFCDGACPLEQMAEAGLRAGLLRSLGFDSMMTMRGGAFVRVPL